ncbi:COP9 signalosome complex subunit 1 [Tanacetum coccineum]
MSVIESLQRKTKEMEENALLTVISSVDDLNYPENMDTCYIVNTPYVFSACWKYMYHLQRKYQLSSFNLLRHTAPIEISLRLNTRTCLRSDIEQHTQPLSFVGSIVLGLWLKFNLVKAIIDSHNKILYARHADQRKVTFQRVLQTGVEFDRDVRAMLLRANILKHEHIYACSRTALLSTYFILSPTLIRLSEARSR